MPCRAERKQASVWCSWFERMNEVVTSPALLRTRSDTAKPSLPA